jgi:tRNA-guanine family transglycosylase
MTSNIGGGGQTVPRIFSYISLLDELPFNNINLLLNFRYLTFYKESKYRKKFDPIFDIGLLKFLDEDHSNSPFAKKIIHFLQKEYINTNRVSSLHQIKSPKNLPKILLDSGAGAIANFLILEKKFQSQEIVHFFEDLITEHAKFISLHKFDKTIAIDYCLKNTYKKDASTAQKENYKQIMENLINSSEKQNNLLKLSLKHLSNTKLLAPIHGRHKKYFIANLNKIKKLELNVGKKFSGFALGGLAEFSRKKNGYSDIGKVIRSIRELEKNRDIHILGSASCMYLPILAASGANTFDCHSPWRRAMDGGSGGSHYKILVPMLKMDGSFISSTRRCLSYVNLFDVNEDEWNCDCGICKKFSLDKIKKLINNRKVNQEDYYLGQILIYFHAVYQHSILLGTLESYKKIEDFIDKIPPHYIYKKSVNSNPSSFKDVLQNEMNLSYL